MVNCFKFNIVYGNKMAFATAITRQRGSVMSYDAKIYKVFIASPSDVAKERDVVCSVIARWNAINAENHGVILLPVGWDTHSAPESGRTAQDYINEEILDRCDILIGIFWSRIGSPTKHFNSGTEEEIARHIGSRKLAMLYFSKKDYPSDVDTEQLNKVREFKKRYQNESLYREFLDANDLYNKLYDHIQIKVNEGKFRSTRDSDLLAKIKDDDELAKQIERYIPFVSKNLLEVIVDENRSDPVWEALVSKLVKSPVYLCESLLFLARRGAFKHKVYTLGYPLLAKCSQHDFGTFIHALHSINKYEFFDIYNQGLLEDSDLARRLPGLISK